MKIKIILTTLILSILLNSKPIIAQEKSSLDKETKNKSTLNKKIKVSKSNKIDHENTETISSDIRNQETIFQSLQIQNPKIKLEFNSGLASGVSYENVLDNDAKISELKWKFHDIAVSKFGVDFNLDDLLIFNISYLSSNNDKYNNSKMTDYDWKGTSGGGTDGNADKNNWTDYSNSIVKTNLYEFDVNAKTKIIKGLYFKLGFRQSRFKFEDRGQNFIYSCSSDEVVQGLCLQEGLRNHFGSFINNNINTINYQQKFKIPYLGLNYSTNFFKDKLYTELYGAYSNMVQASDHDHHILTQTHYKGKFANGQYYNIGFNIGYNFTKNFALNFNYDHSEIPEFNGDVTIHDYSDNTITKVPNGAALSNRTQKIFLGLSYQFNLN